MTPHPRPEADHEAVLATLAFVGLDCPAFDDVLRSLVVRLYGDGAQAAYDAVQRQFDPAPPLGIDAVTVRLSDAQLGGRP